MCYTGMCKHENWQGDCRASSAQRAKDCFLSDYETEQEEQEDADAESTDTEDAADE